MNRVHVGILVFLSLFIFLVGISSARVYQSHCSCSSISDCPHAPYSSLIPGSDFCRFGCGEEYVCWYRFSPFGYCDGTNCWYEAEQMATDSEIRACRSGCSGAKWCIRGFYCSDNCDGWGCYDISCYCKKDCGAQCESDADCAADKYCDLNDCICKAKPKYYCCKEADGCPTPTCAQNCPYGSYAGPFYGDSTCNNSCSYSSCTGSPSPCSTFNNNETKCKGAGCTWDPGRAGYCSGSLNCDKFRYDKDQCKNCPYCYWECLGLPGKCTYTNKADCEHDMCCEWLERDEVCRSVCSSDFCPSACCEWRCTGGASCSGISESACKTCPGCTWNPPVASSCTGTPNPCCSYTTRSTCTSYGCWWYSGGSGYRDSVECTDFCTPGARQCSGDTVQECRNTNADPCTDEWVNIETCSDQIVCSGTNRCGTSEGDTKENRDYYCSGGSCTYTTTTEDCRCDAEDSDNGINLTTRGTCTDYFGCAGGNCASEGFVDSCSGEKILKEYYVSGDACISVEKNCSAEFGSGKITELGFGTTYDHFCNYIKDQFNKGACIKVTTNISIFPPIVRFPGQEVNVTVTFSDARYIQGKKVSFELYIDGQAWDITKNCFGSVNITASGEDQPCDWNYGKPTADCGPGKIGKMRASSKDGYFEVKSKCKIPLIQPGKYKLAAVPKYEGSEIVLGKTETEIQIKAETTPSISPLQKILIFIRTILKGTTGLFY